MSTYITIIPQMRLELSTDKEVVGLPCIRVLVDGESTCVIYAPSALTISPELLAAAAKAFNDILNGPAPVAKLEAAE
jgi:hypothetical protein